MNQDDLIECDNAYQAFCRSLCSVFSKNPEKMQTMFEDCFLYFADVTVQQWKAMKPLAVNRWEGWPRNFVKAVKELAKDAQPVNAPGINVAYNTEEDPRFPIDLLHQGFALLVRTKDYKQFEAFADQVKMPKADRARVKLKAQISAGVIKLDMAMVRSNIAAKATAATRAIEENRLGRLRGDLPDITRVHRYVREVGNQNPWKRFDKAQQPQIPNVIELLVGKEDPRQERQRQLNIRAANIREVGEEG
jgi:hypothetical protein